MAENIEKLYLGNPIILEYGTEDFSIFEELYALGGKWSSIQFDDTRIYSPKSKSCIKDNFADAIIMHVSDRFVFKDEVVKDLQRVVKPNGVVIIIKSMAFDPGMKRIRGGYVVNDRPLNSQNENFRLVDEVTLKGIEDFDMSDCSLSYFRENILKCSAPRYLINNLYNQMVEQMLDKPYFIEDTVSVIWLMNIRFYMLK